MVNMTVEQGAKLIDELICLFALWPEKELVDNSITREALEYISQVRKRNPLHPITIPLANILSERELIE
jgi:hypothetical protein